MANEETVKQDSNPNKGTLGIIFLTIFIDLVGFSIIFPLYPAMLEYYLPREGPNSLIGQVVHFLSSFSSANGDSNSFLTHVLFGGFLGSIYALLQFLFAPVWGSLSDRHGRRPVLIYTITGTTISYLLWIFSGQFALLIFARILGGIMGANLSVATAAIADVTSDKDRSKGMALIGVAFGLGFIVGPAIGGLSTYINLLDFFPNGESMGLNPFSAPALFSFVLAAINLIWVSKMFRETNPIEERKAIAPQSKFSRIREIFTIEEPNVQRTILVYFIFILSFAGMEFTLTFLAVERLAYSPREMVKIFLFIGLTLLIIQGGGIRKLAPTIGEKRLALTGLVLCLAAFALLAKAQTSFLFYLALALLGTGAGLTMPTLSALASLYSEKSEQGRNLGAYRSAGSLARAIGPLVAALLYFFWESQITYLIGAIVIIMPIALGAKLPEPKKL